MNNRKNRGRQLLRELLSPLVKEWGYEEVHRSLSELSSTLHIESNAASGNTAAVITPEKRSKGTRRKLTPTEFVAQLKVTEDRKSALMSLASQFEDKTFLPTVSDVRNFLEMRGQEVHGIKQRTEAFRKVFTLILNMPDESLNKLLKGNAHSGPSALGPLSDAIKTTSTAARSSKEPSSAPDSSGSEKKKEGQD